MSRDYNYLYDFLCRGGEAFAKVIYTGGETDAKWLHKPTPYKTMGLDNWLDYGGIYTNPNIDNDQRSQFIQSCTRLDLQWINPAEISELIASLVKANEETKLYEGHPGKWGDLISKHISG
jgi:hypothetical protein